MNTAPLNIRTIAGDYHTGQHTALYSLASTGVLHYPLQSYLQELPQVPDEPTADHDAEWIKTEGVRVKELREWLAAKIRKTMEPGEQILNMARAHAAGWVPGAHQVEEIKDAAFGAEVFLTDNPDTRNVRIIALPLMEDIKFTIIARQDENPVRGYAMDSGDKEADRKAEDAILARLEYTEWAWALVEVKATYKGISGSAFLGGCSYEDEDDFKKGGYLEQMQAEAYAAIIDQLNDL